MDIDFDRVMDHCLALAAQGGRSVMPNPMVGAALVHNGAILSEGHHQAYGGPHAEVYAIRNVADRRVLAESTLFVTLEPCSHFGKTPPCADLIVESGIRSVVVGCLDPFPAVAGRGVERLRAAGVSVVTGVKNAECILLNRRFILSHRNQRPYVILKWAETADGFVAREDYSSKWISGDESRRLVHQWRSEEMSILVGATTARVDNPELTVRHVAGVDPLRVVIDPKLSVPVTHKLLSSPPETFIFTERQDGDVGSARRVLLDPTRGFIEQILGELHRTKILSLIVEGGAMTLDQFIAQDLWDEARVFIGATTFGSGVRAPHVPVAPIECLISGQDALRIYQHPQLEARLGVELNDPTYCTLHMRARR